MLRINCKDNAERTDLIDGLRHRMDCGVLTLNMTHNRVYQVPVTVFRMDVQPSTHERYALDIELMQLRHVEPFEAKDDVAVLKAQLAARDAALTAVLELAQHWLDVDGQQTASANLYHAQGREIVARLVKHGVHK